MYDERVLFIFDMIIYVEPEGVVFESRYINIASTEIKHTVTQDAITMPLTLNDILHKDTNGPNVHMIISTLISILIKQLSRDTGLDIGQYKAKVPPSQPIHLDATGFWCKQMQRAGIIHPSYRCN